MSHTPGPWRADGCAIKGNRGEYDSDLFRVYCPHTMTQEESDANRRLATAAPDLLEALQALFSAYQMTSEYLDGDIGDDHPIHQAAGAIVKAGGR